MREISKLICPGIGIVAVAVRTLADVPHLCSFVRKKIGDDFIFVSGAIFPVGFALDKETSSRAQQANHRSETETDKAQHG
jgi:hypothetical protein